MFIVIVSGANKEKTRAYDSCFSVSCKKIIDLLERIDQLLDVSRCQKSLRLRRGKEFNEGLFNLPRESSLRIILANMFNDLVVLVETKTCDSVSMLNCSRNQIIFTKARV